MSRIHRVALAAEVQPGRPCAVRAGARDLVVCNVGGRLHALEDLCGHQGMPLSSGDLEGTTLTCAYHGWAYDVRSGRCLTDRSFQLARFPVEVRGGEVWIGEDEIPA